MPRCPCIKALKQSRWFKCSSSLEEKADRKSDPSDTRDNRPRNQEVKLLSKVKKLTEAQSQSKTRVSQCHTASSASNAAIMTFFVEEGEGRKADRVEVESGRESLSIGSGVHLPRVFKKDESKFP